MAPQQQISSQIILSSMVTRRDFLRASVAGIAGVCYGNKCLAATSGPLVEHHARWIILATIDTLRADHLGVYGYPRNVTPFMDELAARGSVFDNAYSVASQTKPAFASLFTSLELPQHLLYSNEYAGFDARIQTLTQALNGAGYTTGAFASVAILEALERGFVKTDFSTAVTIDTYRQAADTVDAALHWLEKRDSSEKVFLWLHLYDPHYPYRAPREHVEAIKAEYSEKRSLLEHHWLEVQRKRADTWPGGMDDLTQCQNGYDADLRYADAQLRRLFEFTSAEGPKDSTVWVVTADHGEGLGTHGYKGHCKYLYNEQLHVPLIFAFSSGVCAGKRISETVRLVDLPLTLADLAGAAMAQPGLTMQGESLEPVLGGQQVFSSARTVFAHRRRRNTSVEQHYTSNWLPDDVYSLQNAHWKYIHVPEGNCELYNLDEDPGELKNIYDVASPEFPVILRAQQLYEKLKSEGAAMIQSDMDYEQHRELLETLGYL